MNGWNGAQIIHFSALAWLLLLGFPPASSVIPPSLPPSLPHSTNPTMQVEPGSDASSEVFGNLFVSDRLLDSERAKDKLQVSTHTGVHEQFQYTSTKAHGQTATEDARTGVHEHEYYNTQARKHEQ